MLEAAVSSALYRLTLLEKALHSPEPWYLSVGAERVRAQRAVVTDGVVFSAVFPNQAGRDVPLISLWHGDELSGTRPFAPPGHDDAYSGVEWSIRLGEAVAA